MKLKILKLKNKLIIQPNKKSIFNLKKNKNYLIIAIMILLGFFIIRNGFAENLRNEKNIIITEIMYNPEGKNSDNSDWVEIFAKNDLNINKDWRIFDEDKNKLKRSKKSGKYLKCHIIKSVENKKFKNNEYFKIKKGEYIVFADNIKKFKNKYPNFNGIIFDTTLNLQTRNNDAVMISMNNCLNFISEMNYDPKEWKNKKGYSLEWDIKNKKWYQSFILGGTPGLKNSKKPKLKKYNNKIRINEILPNPKGNEKKNEFIELYNYGKNDINLENWIIKDNSKNAQFIFSKNTKIKTGKYFLINRNDYKFALNNYGGEKVYLLNPNGEIVDQVKYKKARENISYNFNTINKEWRWSKYLTPNQNNKFDKIPRIEIKIDKRAYKNMYIKFKAKISVVDRNKLKVTWSFGDGYKSYRKDTSHKYKKAGKYEGNVKIFTGSEEFVKKFKIKVKKFPHKKIKIIAMMPNPKGKDNKAEWIEIKNNSKKKINLKNWSIATGSKNGKLINHPIYKKVIIKSGKTKKITWKNSKFYLNNKRCIVELRYPDGSIAYKLKYKKKDGIKDGEIYKKNKGGKWFWLKTINIIDDNKKNKKYQKNDDVYIKNDNKKNKKYSISEIREENFEKQTTLENQNNRIFLIKQLVFEKNKIESMKVLSKNQNNIFGIWGSSIKKVRNDNNIYYFTSKTKKQEYYLKTFWNNIILKFKKYTILKKL